MSDMFRELEHSRVVNELMNLQEKMKRSLFIEFPIAKWNYMKALERNQSSLASFWRTIMIASCTDHEFEDSFEDDGTHIGMVCRHCTCVSDRDEYQDAILVVKKSCSTCMHVGGRGTDITFCNHSNLDTLDLEQQGVWMKKYFEDCENCPFWEGKI